MPVDPSLMTRGRELARAAQYKESLEIFTEILLENPDDIATLFFAGASSFRLNSFQDAKRYWERILEIRPDHEKAKDWLAKIPTEEPSISIPEGDGNGDIASQKGSPAETNRKSKGKRSVPIKRVVGGVLGLVGLVVCVFGFDMYRNPNTYPFLKRDMVDLDLTDEQEAEPVERIVAKIADSIKNGGTFPPVEYQGKVVLLVFWATWCRPCLRDLPELKKVYEDFHQKGFEIVAVSLDKDLEAVRRFKEQE